MAELKWTNVNDSGANSALSNYLTANRAFRGEIAGIGQNLSDFALTMQEGDAQNNRRIRDENTQAILNRMGRITSQEEYDKFIASGATDNQNLRSNLGWYVDMDKVNQAQDNLAQNVYNRALHLDTAKDYNGDVRVLDAKINDALARGDTATYNALLAKRTEIGGKATSATMAKTGYELTKDTFDKNVSGAEKVLSAQDSINKSNMDVFNAEQAMAAFQAKMASIPGWDNPNNLGYESYKAEEAKLAQNLALAKANQASAHNSFDTWKRVYNLNTKDVSPAESTLSRAKQETKKDESTVTEPTSKGVASARSVLAQNQSSEDPANTVAQRVAQTALASTQPNIPEAAEDPSSMNDEQLYDYYLNQAGKDIADKDTSIWGAMKAGQTANQKVDEYQNQLNLDRWKGGDSKAIDEVFDIANKSSTWDEFAKAVVAKPDLVKQFDAVNTATGGALQQRIREQFEQGGKDSVERKTAKESISTTNDTLNNALEGKYIAGKNGADYKYLGLGVISGDGVSVKTKNGETIKLTNSTSQNAKEANKQKLFDLLASDYKTQGTLDSGKWFESLGLRASVENAIDKDADPVAVYSVARKMFDHADGEVDASDFKRNMKKLVDDRDAIAEQKQQYLADKKRLESIQSNRLLNAQLEDWLLVNRPNYKSDEEAVLAGYNAMGLNLNSITGSRPRTQAQEQKAETSLNALEKWMYPAEKEYKDDEIPEVDAYGEPFKKYFGDNYSRQDAIMTIKLQREEIRKKIINGDLNGTSVPRDVVNVYKNGTAEQIARLEKMLKPFQDRKKK